MKNTLKVLGIIALVAVIGFSMAACGEKGGTFIIENRTGETINATVFRGGLGSGGGSKEIENGKSASWTFDEDCLVNYNWYSHNFFGSGSNPVDYGRTVTVTAESN
ncbi:hypothetical protein R84B8_00635 [Treponema sp. R8-4-B8]